MKLNNMNLEKAGAFVEEVKNDLLCGLKPRSIHSG